MKPWRETIPLTQPLRGIRMAATRSPREETDRQLREREQAAFERGRQAGEQALSHQLLQQRREVLELQQGVLQSLTQSVPLLLKEVEGLLVELAVEAARKWMAGQPVDGPAIEATVREAMAQMEQATEFQILLNEEDLALLERQQSPLLTPASAPANTRISASAEVPRGGCIVQTQFGSVDARRETKVVQFQNALHP
jgi:flagellar assembly protein FliH